MSWDKNQKILDLRADWWAVKAGLIKTPDVKRIVMVNLGGQIGQNMDLVAQRIVNNEMDSCPRHEELHDHQHPEAATRR